MVELNAELNALNGSEPIEPIVNNPLHYVTRSDIARHGGLDNVKISRRNALSNSEKISDDSEEE